MLLDLLDGKTGPDISLEHGADQIDAALAHDPRHAKLVIQDLIDTVERVLLVDERVEQDAQRPHVLLLTAVRFALEDLGRGVV